MRQNSKYHVAVSSHGYDVPQKFEVCIKGEEKVIEGQQKTVTLNGNNTEVLKYDVSVNKTFILILSFFRTNIVIPWNKIDNNHAKRKLNALIFFTFE